MLSIRSVNAAGVSASRQISPSPGRRRGTSPSPLRERRLAALRWRRWRRSLAARRAMRPAPSTSRYRRGAVEVEQRPRRMRHQQRRSAGCGHLARQPVDQPVLEPQLDHSASRMAASMPGG
jgi:hypothetical protein